MNEAVNTAVKLL